MGFAVYDFVLEDITNPISITTTIPTTTIPTTTIPITTKLPDIEINLSNRYTIKVYDNKKFGEVYIGYQIVGNLLNLISPYGFSSLNPESYIIDYYDSHSYKILLPIYVISCSVKYFSFSILF
jgi:hypothetical protein